MLESSFRLGSIAGIRIGVHYTWLIIFFLLVSSLFALFSASHAEWSMTAALLSAVFTTLLFFTSIVLHELGHSLVAIARGIRVRSITLFIFGGVAQTEQEASTPATEFWVAIAGPLVSFGLAGLFYLLKLWLAPYSDMADETLGWLARINLILAIFNLIPGFPLDGGRVFRALVWQVTGNANKGMQWAVIGGRFVAFGLMFLGLLTVMQTGLLINGLWLLGIGWFLLSAAEASGRAYVMEHMLKDIAAGDIMQKEVPTVAANMMISDWLDQHVLLTGHRACLVKQHDRIIGLVTLSDAIKSTRRQWPTTPLHAVMTPVEALYTVRPSSGVNEVLKLMRLHSLNQVPVVDSGQFVGWIDRQHLLKIMQLHDEAGR